MIAYEHNVEAMWPFPKFATQLIHVSEHHHSETSRAASFLGAALWPDGVELEYNYDCSVRLQLPAVRGCDGNAVDRYHHETAERREGEAVLPAIAPIRSPQAIFAFAAGCAPARPARAKSRRTQAARGC